MYNKKTILLQFLSIFLLYCFAMLDVSSNFAASKHRRKHSLGETYSDGGDTTFYLTTKFL